jgi:dihydrodiol dehydrogenase / D-xylose 1-dehydrogenase (NADP)
MAPLRWGFIGTGNINNDFAAALVSLPKEEHQIVSVSSADAAKAEKFAQLFSIPKSYGRYADVASDPDVEIVYIGTVNSSHYHMAKLALENDKHVLCEKPLTLLLKHTQELIALAKEKRKFFLEGIWSRFFPSYKKLREEISSQTVGDVKLISANFGLNNWIVDLFAKKDRGGGSMMDIGVYLLQFAVAVYGTEMPKTVKACGILGAEGVDMCVTIILQYEDGRMAQLMSSYINDPPNDAYVYGSKGNIKLPAPFWCPTDVVVKDQVHSFPLPQVQFKMMYTNMEGLVYEAQEVHRCIKNGLTESPFMTHEESITIARIMEAVKQEIGLTYDDLYEKK